MMEPIKTLIRAGTCAPSGDNTQPWHFAVDADGASFDLSLDPQRDTSPMNAGNRMARIACGAALENILQTLEFNGWEFTLETGGKDCLARVRLAESVQTPGEIDPVILSRTTNRRVYTNEPLSDATQCSLSKRTPELNGVQTHWIVEREKIESLAELIGRADAAMFGAKPVRDAFLDKVRFDAPPLAQVDDGLCLGSLELSPFQRLTLRSLRMPDFLLKLAGARRTFTATATRLVRSAAGLCLITSKESSDIAETKVGRAMQRAWLALTSEGLAVQPMMSLLVLQTIRDNAPPAIREAVGASQIETLLEEFHAFVHTLGDGVPGALMRFGYASPPTARTGRLPLEKVIT